MQQKANKNWLRLTVYMPEQILSGSFHYPAQQRLLDSLNGGFDMNGGFVPQHAVGGNFLKLDEVLAASEDKTSEAHPSSYINTTNIQIVTLDEPDLARGAGAKISTRHYPYVSKTLVRANLDLPAYTVTGNMHCASGQSLQDVVNGILRFLPVTDVSIKVKQSGKTTSAAFAAVNGAQILSLRETES